MADQAAKWQGEKRARKFCCSATFQLSIALLIFFALALGTAVASSPTVDESTHIFRGRVLWQTGQMRFQAKHMPFTHWLNGALLFTEPTLPDVTDLPSWSKDDRPTLAREFLWDYEPQPNITRVFLLARLPIIWLGLLLGAVLARWGRAFSGAAGQGVVLLLFAFSPNLLANFSLATTDGPLTALFVMAVFAWIWYWKRPSNWRWLLSGIILGLALGSKLTAILLLPILFLLSYVYWQRSRPWWRPALIWFSILPIAGLVFWALYGFELRSLPGIPFPVPAATYVSSFLKLQDDTTGHYTAYMLGKSSMTGWWYYFIIALLIKTPVPTLLLLATAVYQIIRQRTWRETAVYWLPAAILFTFASYSRLNIGYRHILPVLPFIFLLAATVFQNMRLSALTHASPVKTGLVLILSAWYIVGGLRQQPHYLAYFNELIGGPDQGYHYLGDSNIDWGQSLKFLARYADEGNIHPDYISYFGAADPAYYGLQTTPLFDSETDELHNFSRANPVPGQYAISVNHLLGQLSESDMFDWFRRLEPTDNVGYSILIYDVPQQAPGSWVAYCADPSPLLDEMVTTQLVGKTNLRPVYFDCRNSWVFPDDGNPGWYILPQQDEWPVTILLSDHLQPVYVHAASTLEPSYAVWYWDGEMDLAEWTAVTNNQGELPVRFGETADLTGYLVNELDWWTVWHVQNTPSAPLTIAAHLYADDLSPTVADSLGFTSEQWRPGDWLVQIHHFETSGHSLETGLYNYLTGDKLADFAQLHP